MTRRIGVMAMSMTLFIMIAGCGQNGVSPATFVPSGEAVAATPAAASSSNQAPSSSQAPSTGSPATSAAATDSSATPTPSPTPASTPEPFVLVSSAFEDGAAIPRASTCDGADRSPALSWTGVPDGAGALVLEVDDPDAGGFVHWLVLDLTAGAAGSLPSGVATGASSPQQGRNGFGRVGWGGPCPPSGTHHYVFTLSALAAPLGLPGHPDGGAVKAALKAATVLGRATLTGTYRRG